jgi:hypothetical protein
VCGRGGVAEEDSRLTDFESFLSPHPDSVRMIWSRRKNFAFDGLEDTDRKFFG